jgi:ssDNA-binding Zn-finger/Zn-ribbon topoisomerase 1
VTAPQATDVQAVCSACGTRVVIRRGRPGVVYKCPKCKGVLEPIDLGVPSSRPAGGSRTATKHFTVTCPLCQTEVHASADQIGQSVDCPNCLTDVQVGRPDISAIPDEEDDRAESAAQSPTAHPLPSPREAHVGQKEGPTGGTLISMPPPPDDKYFAVVCPLCHTRLEATREQVGQSITCPDCRRPFEIKAPPPAVAKYRWSQDDGVELRFEPTFERPQLERPVLPVVEEERKPRGSAAVRRAQPLPQRAMVSGVASFLGYANVWPRWLGCSIALMIPLGLFDYGFMQLAEAKGKVSWLTAAVLFSALVSSLLWFMSISRTLLAILDDTSEGLDRVENWPEGNVFGGLRAALLIFYGLVLSLVPAGAICSVIGGFVEGSWLVIPPLSVLLLFPLFLLSMLEADSALEPFSSDVWQSLSEAREAWIGMYVISGVIWGLVGLIDWLTSEMIPIQEARIVIGPLVFTGGLLVYYRLLGRLAWMLAVRLDDADVEGTTNDANDTKA